MAWPLSQAPEIASFPGFPAFAQPGSLGTKLGSLGTRLPQRLFLHWEPYNHPDLWLGQSFQGLGTGYPRDSSCIGTTITQTYGLALTIPRDTSYTIWWCVWDLLTKFLEDNIIRVVTRIPQTALLPGDTAYHKVSVSWERGVFTTKWAHLHIQLVSNKQKQLL